MPKPEFLRDLDRSEERKAAKLLFNGQTTVHLEGYVVTLPKFDDLGDHIQMFIMKALGQGKLRNVLDTVASDSVAHYPIELSDPFPVDDDGYV